MLGGIPVTSPGRITSVAHPTAARDQPIMSEGSTLLSTQLSSLESGRVGDEIGHHLAEPNRIASYPEIAWHLKVEHMCSLIEEWTGDLDAFGHEVRHTDMSFLDRHLSS